MTTLTATAIISAVDRASAVFARVGANAQRLGGRFTTASAGVARFGQAAAMNLGMPAAFAGALAARGEYEVDRIARTMQAVGELTDQQRDMLTKTSFDVSMLVGKQAQDLVRAQKELIQGGLDPETTAALTSDIAKVAKTNEMALNEVAEMGINAARGMGMAFDTTAQKVASIRGALNFMTVVPAASTENVEGLRESLKYAAPIAGMLKIQIEELGAALSILADRGFKGEEGGTAFRTILLRGIAPTKQLATAYRAAGIQLDELYKLDETKLKDMEALRERVLGAGIGGNERVIDRALKRTGGLEKYEGLYEYQDALMNNLSDALGIGPGDAQDKGILKKVVDQHLFSAIDGFDLTKFFTAIARLPLSDFAKVAGIQRSAQAQSLKEDIERLPPLTEKFKELMPGAIDRQFNKVGQGFSHSLDVIGAALGKMRHAIFDSGVGTGLADLFTRFANSIDNLSRTNPSVLNAIGIGLAAMVAAPAAGAVIWGIAASLGALSTVLASPALAGLLAAGGLAAMFGDLQALFRGGNAAVGGAIVNVASPMEQFISSVWNLASEQFALLNDIAGAAARVVTEIGRLFGLQFEGSLLAMSLRALSYSLDGIAGTIGMVRDLASRFGSGDWTSPVTLPNYMRDLGEWAHGSTREAGGQKFNFIGGAAPIQVESRVTGQAEVKSSVDVHLIVPESFRAYVAGQRGGTATVPLNTGESMPDAAPAGAAP